jgi:hypothetical protein
MPGTLEAVLDTVNAAGEAHLTGMRGDMSTVTGSDSAHREVVDKYRSLAGAIKASRENILLSRTFRVEDPVWRTRHANGVHGWHMTPDTMEGHLIVSQGSC